MGIFIYGEVPSSKNSKIPLTSRKSKNGFMRPLKHPVIISSNFTQKYKKASENQWIIRATEFMRMRQGKGKPLHVKFRFVRRTNGIFDFLNMGQIIQDLMKKHGWIDDDDYTNIVPYFDENVEIDKDNAGVEISIL
jgi:hypothetical protein